MIREFIAYKMIETARAKARCGCRWDLVPNSAPGEDTMPSPEDCIYPLTTLKQDLGKARDLAAKKVGLSGSTAALGEKVVHVIDRLLSEKKYTEVIELRHIFREKSINAAHRKPYKKAGCPPPQNARAKCPMRLMIST